MAGDMALSKSMSRQTYFSLSMSNSLSDMNGFQRSPLRTPNIRLKNRLDEAWTRAEKKFYEDTKKFLGSYDIKSKDSVLRHLKQRYEAECKDGKSAQITAFERILNALELVGAFAAQGVSIVFGPANLCFNAVTFLIDAPRQILHVYKELESLFEEVERFLVKFKIYRRIEDAVGLAQELCEAANFLLISFVKVCGTATSIIQGGKKAVFKSGAMLLLCKDDKLGAAIEEFKALCHSSSSLANTVMLENVLTSEANVRQILSSARRLEVGVGLLIARSNDEKTKIVNKNHLDRIRHNLYIHSPIEEALIPSNQENGIETLATLQSIPEYDRWMNSPGMAASILVIWGPSGSGKSYMLDTVRDNLNIRRECAGRVESSIYVAVHDFKAVNAHSSKGHGAGVLMADVLRKIAFQVAVQSTTYAKELATLSSSNPNLRSEKDLTRLWGVLRLSEHRALSGATMYVLLDAVQKRHLSGELRKLLDLLMDTGSSKPRSGLKIRILLTMNERPETVRTSQFFQVALNDINKRLLANFAIEEMRRRDILQDFDGETISLRQEFCKKLVTNRPDVTFTSIDQRLTALKQAIDQDQPSSKIQDVLDSPDSKQWYNKSSEILKKLHIQLSERSITLLNNILLFLLCVPDGCMSLELLEAGLRLGGFELPIEPLVKKIRIQYKDVISMHHGTVSIHPAVLPAFCDFGDGKINLKPNKPKNALVNVRIEINDATEHTVKTFFWDLNQQITQGNFSFCSTNTISMTPQIRVNGLQAHLFMTKLCLEVVSKGWNDKTEPMLTYACLYLPAHLITLQDMSTDVDEADTRMIGEGLISYLTDPYHVRSKHRSYGFGQWMHEDRSIDAIRFWLGQSKQYLPPREQRWIERSLHRSCGRLGFLQDLAIALGECWVTDIRSSCLALYSWLNTYIEQANLFAQIPHEKSLKRQHTFSPALTVEETNQKSRQISPRPSYSTANNHELKNRFERPLIELRRKKNESGIPGVEDLPHISKIQRTAAWVVSNLRVTPRDSLFLAIGNTCIAVEEFAYAIEYFNKVQPEYANRHYALLGTAFCRLALGDVTNGLSVGREAFQVFRRLADQNILLDDELEYYLSSLRQMAGRLEGLRRLPEALSLYEEAFSRDPGDATITWSVLKLRCQVDHIQNDAYTTFLDWSLNNEQSASVSPSVTLLKMVGGAEFDTLLLPLCRAMRNQYLQGLFVQVVDDALQLASGSDETSVIVRLRYLQSITFGLSSETGSSLSAVQSWNEVLTAGSEHGDGVRTRSTLQLMVAAADNILRSDFNNLRARMLSDTTLTQHEKHQLYLGFTELFNATICPALADYRGVDSAENFIVSLCSMVDMDEAKRVYKKDMAQALEILIDNDENNDAAGIYILSRIFCAIGDVVSMLSAFSLYDRAITRVRFSNHEERGTLERQWTTRERAATGIVRTCTLCNRTIYSSDVSGIWWCRFCPNFELCNECKEKYEEDIIRHERCSRQHVSSYVHLKHFDYTEADLAGQRVRIDWKFVSDNSGGCSRRGGRVVELEDWMEEIRVLWELPEPEGKGSRAQH